MPRLPPARTLAPRLARSQPIRPVPLETACVVGAGVAGLAVSIRLALQGFRVLLFEASPHPGGKLSELRLGRYRFDFGPSLFTLPELVDELYRLAGREPSEHFRYQRLDEANRYHFEDGTRLVAYSHPERFAREAERVLGVPAAVVIRYLDHSRALNERTRELFLGSSLHRVRTYLQRSAFAALAYLPRMGLLSSLHDVNVERLQHPKLVQLFDRFATYNGSSPYRTPGVMAVIPSLEHGSGAFLPEGGMHGITRSLTELALSVGVELHLSEPVRRIRVENERVTGVVTDRSAYEANVVVSNMDVVPTYRRLLPNRRPPKRILSEERSSSAIVFYWGVRGPFPELGLHNIFFSRDYAGEFEYLFDRHDLHEDPTVYVNITSKHVPSDAPPGAENWFVMINAPANVGQDWDALVRKSRARVLAKLERMLGRDIAPQIEVEEVLDPRRLEARTFSYRGSLYGTASNDRLAAFLRHPNFHAGIRGLYFAGGSVHPGGGIPLCLLSAKITSQLIEEDR